MNHKKSLFFPFLCFLLLAGGSSLSAKIPTADKTRLNEGWQFVKTDLGSVWEAVRAFKPGGAEAVPEWTDVTLPHCYNAEDSVDPDVAYYEGPAWYRTTLAINNPYKDGRTILEFEGAGQRTEVYVFTTKVGAHTGGYDSWNVDITDAVQAFLAGPDAARFEGKVPLVIRCDNTRDTEMIPSDLSDFNVYGGLYRYLNLVYVPAVSVSELKIQPSLNDERQAGHLILEARFYNPKNLPSADVAVTVKDAVGKTVLKKRFKDLDLNGDGKLLDVPFKKPRLWDVEDPYLYTCEVSVSADGQTCRAGETFGFRSFTFVDHGPFLLNGRRLLLRGTHRHEDHAGLGAAMTEDLMVQEMELMKSMGVNFIRLGHYQQSEIILNLCDRLGILVWEEIPWCRGGLGGPAYQNQARQMLSNMISQHYNHPAVIIWGLGNENDWPNDFPVFDKEQIRAFMSELNDLSHRLDPERKTAIRRCDFCRDIVDVYSPSIWAGWYRGVYTDYKAETLKEMGRVNHFLHVEWGGDSHAGRHSEDIFANIRDVQGGQGADERAGDASLYGGEKRVSRDGNWSESYIVRLMDWHLKEQETLPDLTGAACWIFKDFSTPIRPENPIPYMNQKGVVQRDLTPKEAFYVFQSYWTEKPMIHIYGHGWPVRWGGEKDLKEVLVYSNCSEAELFVNGQSQGRRVRDSQDFPAAGLHWYVSLKPGENHVRAIGTAKDGSQVSDEIRFRYETEPWGAAAALALTQEALGEGLVRVNVQVVDAAGRACLDAKEFIRFQIAGDGALIKNQGTVSGSSKIQAQNGRASICVKTQGGRSAVAVSSEGLPTETIIIQ